MAHSEDDDSDSTAGGDSDASFESEFVTERRTAPQSPYSTRDVLVGAGIAAVGMIVTFGVPLVLT